MNWIHPDRLDSDLVEEMTAYESYLHSHFPGSTVVVHADWADAGHVTDSQHYLGKAVDFHVAGVSVADAWLALERFVRFTGIGWYPNWNTPGFHADTRSPVPFRARWIRNGSTYTGFDLAGLKNMTESNGGVTRSLTT